MNWLITSTLHRTGPVDSQRLRFRRLHPIPNDSGWLQTIPDDSGGLRTIPNDSGFFRATPDGVSGSDISGVELD